MKRLDTEIMKQIEPLYLQLGSGEKVGKQLNIDPKTAIRYLKKLGYDFSNKHHKPTISYNDALEKFKNSNLSVTQFCKENKISMKWFLIYLNKSGIFVENKQNAVKFDETIFDKIDSEEKAYWLGFLFADGYISALKENSKHNYHFELSLKADDVQHLYKFNSFMKHIKNNVSIGKVNCNDKVCKRCRWSVRNKHLWEALNSKGCVPKKSLILKFPDKKIFTDKSLIRHFIRGYFDGDGCISYTDKTHKRSSFSLLGTEEFLKRLVTYLPIQFKIRKELNRTVWIGRCTGKSSIKNLNFLYNDCSIYLDRKYQRYLEFCRLSEKSDKLLQGKIGEDCDVNPEVN